LESKVEISLRLRQFIDRHFGGNASALAKKMGISNQVLEKYTSGKKGIGLKQLLRLASLSCDLNWLLTGKSFNNDAIVENQETIKTLIEQNSLLEKKIIKIENHNDLLLEQNQKFSIEITRLIEFGEIIVKNFFLKYKDWLSEKNKKLG
jgi:transcriptional regulator with XRE-family HTH domain